MVLHPKDAERVWRTSLSQAELFQTDIRSTGVLPLPYAGQGPSLNTFLHLSVAFFTCLLLCLKLAAILSKKRSGVGDTASVLAAWIHHLQSVGDAGTLPVCFVHALESEFRLEGPVGLGSPFPCSTYSRAILNRRAGCSRFVCHTQTKNEMGGSSAASLRKLSQFV